MASLRYRNGKWQVQVRRYGHTPQAKSFQSKADAHRWVRHIEAELDRSLIPGDPRLLSTITVAQILTRYRDTITDAKRGRIVERKRIEVFLRPTTFSKYRDMRLQQVRLTTVNHLAAHDDAAFGEADLLPDLRHLIPPSLLDGWRDEFGADVAFAEEPLIHRFSIIARHR